MQFLKSANEISRIDAENCFVLCDSNTLEHCLPLLHTKAEFIVIPAGEESKQLKTCESIWDRLIFLGADRRSELICLGGGVICDMGAFAASCFQRGIDFSLYPTSLLAMVDASHGGKSGVDYRSLKNYIGLFTQAKETVICEEFLSSLPEAEWINGKMEMIKHGLIHDRSHFNQLKGDGPHDYSMINIDLIKRSIEIKEWHCQQDPLEKGIRKRLNFGHTIAHAIESHALNNSQMIPHGLAVGIGMIAEAYLSHSDWSLSQEEFTIITEYLKPLLKEVDTAWLQPVELMPYIQKDKKNYGSSVYFSLLTSVGHSQENIHIPEAKIKEAILYLSSLK